jgi:thioredoxin-related protein
MSDTGAAAGRRLLLIALAIAVLGGAVVLARYARPGLSIINGTLRRATGAPRAPHIAKHSDPDYDPGRDPAKDLQAATDLARRDGKRILLVVGGRWCSWCGKLGEAMRSRPGVAELQSRYFVTLKVNFSPENENSAFLSRFPPIDDYPHLLVLSQEGRLLHEQGADDLLEGKAYSGEKLTKFLEAWKP